MSGSEEKVVLREREIGSALVRIAHEIHERNPQPPVPALVGIHSRGAYLAERLRPILAELLGAEVPLGDLDIGFYRDDVALRPEAPVLHASHIDFAVAERTIVIVDDVLYTGRTVRAAIDALFDYGRPARLQLAVLVDRGHRELPIRPDYVGKNLPTALDEHVQVRLRECDGRDEVAIGGAQHGVALPSHQRALSAGMALAGEGGGSGAADASGGHRPDAVEPRDEQEGSEP